MAMRSEAHVRRSNGSVAAGSSIRQQSNDRDVDTGSSSQDVVGIVGHLRFVFERKSMVFSRTPIGDFRFMKLPIDVCPDASGKRLAGSQLNAGTSNGILQGREYSRPLGNIELLAQCRARPMDWHPFAIGSRIILMFSTSAITNLTRQCGRGRSVVSPRIDPSRFVIARHSLMGGWARHVDKI